MSKTARILIASLAIFAGICSGALGIIGGMKAPAGGIFLLMAAAFCFVVAAACLSPRSRSVTIPIIVVVFVVIVAIAVPYMFLVWGGLFLVLLLAAVVQGLVAGRRDRPLTKAVKLTQAGDPDGAVAMLHSRLHQEGPSPLAYRHLALLLSFQNKYLEALKVIEDAEREGHSSPDLQATKGISLWKLGRLQEALPLLRDAYQRYPKNLFSVCNYGCLLAEMNRLVEASEALEHAQRIYSGQIILGNSSVRKLRQQQLDELRQTIEDAQTRFETY